MKAVDHKITITLDIDGQEFVQGVVLCADVLRDLDGVRIQTDLVKYLTKSIDMTIKHELGRQGEPAFMQYSGR